MLRCAHASGNCDVERVQSHGERPRTDTAICAEVLPDEDAAPGCQSENTDPTKQSADGRRNERRNEGMTLSANRIYSAMDLTFPTIRQWVQ